MPAHSASKSSSFGARLAQLRKAAGYTQQRLAENVGASRRQIAYYENESQRPPANLLASLARVLTVSVDDLLGAPTAKRSPKPSAFSPRLERRMRQIETLTPKSKQQLLGLIDTFIAAERSRHGAKP